MKGTRAAIRYAKAVLNLAIELKKADEVNENMQLIGSTINGSKDLQVVLKSPIIKAQIKRNTLHQLFDPSINAISKGLIDQLVDNKRLPLLSEIAKQYAIMFDHHMGTQIAEVTSAVALTDQLKVKVLAKVKELVGKKVDIKNIVDPSIIGGFILRVGDKQFDASISGKFNKLRREFGENLYIGKF